MLAAHLALLCCISVIASALQPSSPLVGTRWRLRLNVGLEDRTWMNQRFPGWGESGDRLLLNTTVEFTGEPCRTSEQFVGPRDATCKLKICRGPSSLVTEQGEQNVVLADGGWNIWRPETVESELEMPGYASMLRFWLDCPSGAAQSDVQIFPDTRIFFFNWIWDNPNAKTEYGEALLQLQRLQREQEGAQKEKEVGFLQRALNLQRSREEEAELKRLTELVEKLELELPPPEASAEAISAANGVRLESAGALRVKGETFFGQALEYLIYGSFYVLAEDRADQLES